MSIHSTRRHLLGALGTGGLALGPAACGSSDPFEEEGSGSAGSDGGGEGPSGALAIGSQGYYSNGIIADGAGPDDPATIVDATTGVFYGVVVAAVLLLVSAWSLPSTPGSGPVRPVHGDEK